MRITRQHRRGFRGYTLVEVLVAVTLMAVVLPVAMRGISLAASLAGQTKRRTQAAELARSKLDELAATGDWRTGNTAGDFGTDWPNFRWTATTGDWSGVASVEELSVEVTWTDGRGQGSITMTTLVSTQAQ